MTHRQFSTKFLQLLLGVNPLHFDKDFLLLDLPFLFAHLLEVVCAHDAHQLVLETGCRVKSLAEYVLHLFKFEFLG